MKFLPYSCTPLTRMNTTSSKLGCDIYCKRDDLFERDGGGSKARMLQYILADVTPLSYDVVLTAGGPCSNFNRACAMACARLDVPMHLVVYTDNQQEFKTSVNYKICKAYKIVTTVCQKNDVPQTIQQVKAMYEEQGKRVKLVYGGGKSLEGTYAYFRAVDELQQQLADVDHIFVACGTGTTLAGLSTGAALWFPKAQVHAISVARAWLQEENVLKELLKEFREYLSNNTEANLDDPPSNIKYYEQFLYGGYARSSVMLHSDIDDCMRNEGILVDPIYVGKAWHGMVNIIKQEPASFKGKRIVFWNTGGVYTLLSSLPSVIG